MHITNSIDELVKYTYTLSMISKQIVIALFSYSNAKLIPSPKINLI